jgi:hypothetical protein
MTLTLRVGIGAFVICCCPHVYGRHYLRNFIYSLLNHVVEGTLQ